MNKEWVKVGLSSQEENFPLKEHLCAGSEWLFLGPLAGHVILSAGKNGLVAVSSPVNGATIRVIRDHKGVPITTIQSANEQVSSLNQTKE